MDYEAEYAAGGGTHNESVGSALEHIRNNFPQCENVLFLDAARPFVTAGAIDRYYEYLTGYDAVITARRITDSLGKKGGQFVDRSDYYLIQKPEAFKFNLLYSHFDANSAATAIVQQLPGGARLYKYFDPGLNMKITHPDDLIIAEQLMRIRGEMS